MIISISMLLIFAILILFIMKLKVNKRFGIAGIVLVLSLFIVLAGYVWVKHAQVIPGTLVWFEGFGWEEKVTRLDLATLETQEMTPENYCKLTGKEYIRAVNGFGIYRYTKEGKTELFRTGNALYGQPVVDGNGAVYFLMEGKGAVLRKLENGEISGIENVRPDVEGQLHIDGDRLIFSQEDEKGAWWVMSYDIQTGETQTIKEGRYPFLVKDGEILCSDFGNGIYNPDTNIVCFYKNYPHYQKTSIISFHDLSTQKRTRYLDYIFYKLFRSYEYTDPAVLEEPYFPGVDSELFWE